MLIPGVVSDFIITGSEIPLYNTVILFQLKCFIVTDFFQSNPCNSLYFQLLFRNAIKLPCDAFSLESHEWSIFFSNRVGGNQLFLRKNENPCILFNNWSVFLEVEIRNHTKPTENRSIFSMALRSRCTVHRKTQLKRNWNIEVLNLCGFVFSPFFLYFWCSGCKCHCLIPKPTHWAY